jgi:hypothetical protein
MPSCCGRKGWGGEEEGRGEEGGRKGEVVVLGYVLVTAGIEFPATATETLFAVR